MDVSTHSNERHARSRVPFVVLGLCLLALLSGCNRPAGTLCDDSGAGLLWVRPSQLLGGTPMVSGTFTWELRVSSPSRFDSLAVTLNNDATLDARSRANGDAIPNTLTGMITASSLPDGISTLRASGTCRDAMGAHEYRAQVSVNTDNSAPTLSIVSPATDDAVVYIEDPGAQICVSARDNQSSATLVIRVQNLTDMSAEEVIANDTVRGATQCGDLDDVFAVIRRRFETGMASSFAFRTTVTVTDSQGQQTMVSRNFTVRRRTVCTASLMSLPTRLAPRPLAFPAVSRIAVSQDSAVSLYDSTTCRFMGGTSGGGAPTADIVALGDRHVIRVAEVRASIVDVSTGAESGMAQITPQPSSTDTQVTAVAAQPGTTGTLAFALAFRNGTVTTYSFSGGAVSVRGSVSLPTAISSVGEVTHLAVSPDGSLVYAATNDATGGGIALVRNSSASRDARFGTFGRFVGVSDASGTGAPNGGRVLLATANGVFFVDSGHVNCISSGGADCGRSEDIVPAALTRSGIAGLVSANGTIIGAYAGGARTPSVVFSVVDAVPASGTMMMQAWSTLMSPSGRSDTTRDVCVGSTDCMYGQGIAPLGPGVSPDGMRVGIGLNIYGRLGILDATDGEVQAVPLLGIFDEAASEPAIFMSGTGYQAASLVFGAGGQRLVVFTVS